jgi:hypothetical protein
MPRPKRPLSTWRSLFQLLWMQPLIAIPFAFLFGTMNGASRTAYIGAYIGALYFSYSIGLSIWTPPRPAAFHSHEESWAGR